MVPDYSAASPRLGPYRPCAGCYQLSLDDQYSRSQVLDSCGLGLVRCLNTRGIEAAMAAATTSPNLLLPREPQPSASAYPVGRMPAHGLDTTMSGSPSSSQRLQSTGSIQSAPASAVTGTVPGIPAPPSSLPQPTPLSPSAHGDGDIEMDLDESSNKDVSDAESAGNPNVERPKKKAKGQRFFCTGYPPCNLSFTRSEHLARHIRYVLPCGHAMILTAL